MRLQAENPLSALVFRDLNGLMRADISAADENHMLYGWISELLGRNVVEGLPYCQVVVPFPFTETMKRSVSAGPGGRRGGLGPVLDMMSDDYHHLVQVFIFVFAYHRESVSFIVRNEIVYAIEAEHAASDESLCLSCDINGMVYEYVPEAFGRCSGASQLSKEECLSDTRG